jgi:hypothetical protein
VLPLTDGESNHIRGRKALIGLELQNLRRPVSLLNGIAHAGLISLTSPLKAAVANPYVMW